MWTVQLKQNVIRIIAFFKVLKYRITVVKLNNLFSDGLDIKIVEINTNLRNLIKLSNYLLSTLRKKEFFFNVNKIDDTKKVDREK